MMASGNEIIPFASEKVDAIGMSFVFYTHTNIRTDYASLMRKFANALPRQ